MKKFWLTLLFWFAALMIHGQITLEYCQQMARKNYPLTRQYNLIEQSAKYNISQIHKAYLPQISLNGKATWQSDALRFPDEFSDLLDQMGASIDFPPQDQYNIALELTQTIWDGGITSGQKKSVDAQKEVDKNNLEVNLYALVKQINQLFFSVLLIDEQIKQNNLLLEELERNYKTVLSHVDAGIAHQSDLDEVTVEILSAEQRDMEMKTSRKTFIRMLNIFIGEEIGDRTLIKPSAKYDETENIHRPELKLFDAQIRLFDTQSITLWNRGMPRIALFAQGAYGNPGLNMFESGFKPYFIGGIQLAWNFSGFYTNKNEKQLLGVQKQQVEIQRETFLFNTRQEIEQKNGEIEKLRNLLIKDDEIIKLRENIQETAEFKVENGTMSVNELLRSINSANIARQNRSYHEIELLLAVWQLRTETGIELNHSK